MVTENSRRTLDHTPSWSTGSGSPVAAPGAAPQGAAAQESQAGQECRRRGASQLPSLCQCSVASEPPPVKQTKGPASSFQILKGLSGLHASTTRELQVYPFYVRATLSLIFQGQ